MATTHRLAAILRDAAKRPLLRMRSELFYSSTNVTASGMLALEVR
jgi:hypothetical protein